MEPSAQPVRRSRWWLVAAVTVVVLLLVLLPPLINVSRYAHRAADTMSSSLGRPVHLDDVQLHLLPTPTLTLQNLVVSEDPAFGTEPVIRANSVDATIRLRSLWRRRVEFATVRFHDPSVNLVRRADGRWNLESILLHAAQARSLPTTQRATGPAPRFPYIEATGARVNVKLGNEKLPLSLSDTSFALWLPEPARWSLRLSGTPLRTDTNVDDAGRLSVEGTLGRAAHATDVPVDLEAAWQTAPLGQLSRVLLGDDAGWRGLMDATATLHGTLGSAALTAHLQFNDVHRADSVPAHLMELGLNCSAQMSTTVASLDHPGCAALLPTLPDGTAPTAVIQAASMKLTGLVADMPSLTLQAVPLSEWLNWAGLFSPRIVQGETPLHGVVNAHILRPAPTTNSGPSSPGEAHFAGWTGDVSGTLDPPCTAASATTSAAGTPPASTPPTAATWTATLADGTLSTSPITLAASGMSTAVASGTGTPWTVAAKLNAVSTQLVFAGALPQASDAATCLRDVRPLLDDVYETLAAATPAHSLAAAEPTVDCIRTLGGPQHCTLAPGAVPAMPGKAHRTGDTSSPKRRRR